MAINLIILASYYDKPNVAFDDAIAQFDGSAFAMKNSIKNSRPVSSLKSELLQKK